MVYSSSHFTNCIQMVTFELLDATIVPTTNQASEAGVGGLQIDVAVAYFQAFQT